MHIKNDQNKSLKQIFEEGEKKKQHTKDKNALHKRSTNNCNYRFYFFFFFFLIVRLKYIQNGNHVTLSARTMKFYVVVNVFFYFFSWWADEMNANVSCTFSWGTWVTFIVQMLNVCMPRIHTSIIIHQQVICIPCTLFTIRQMTMEKELCSKCSCALLVKQCERISIRSQR